MLSTVLGCLVESLGMVVVTSRCCTGAAAVRYRFGVILVLSSRMGQISPPIGINLFVIQNIWTGKSSAM